MAEFQGPRRSFASGEISDDLDLRSDLSAYRFGLAKCRNFMVRPQGGVERTPGTRFVAAVKDSTKSVRLIPFVFSNMDSVMVEAGEAYMRFFKDKSAIIDGMSPHEVATSYVEADLPTLQPVQSADVVWIFSQVETKELQRIQVAPDRFQFVDATFRNGPFLDRNTDETHTMTASGVTGSVTLTSSTAFFSADHVGAYFRLEEEDLSDVPKWLGNKSYDQGDKVRVGGSVYEKNNAGTDTSSANAPSHLEGIENDGEAIDWEYLHSGFGIVKITAFTDDQNVTAEVQPYKRLPDSVQTGTTWKWAEGAWSDVQGWPRAGALYDNRLVGANTPAFPYWTWWSALGGFDDFEDGTLDDQGISRPLQSGEVNPIRWMTPGVVMLVATDGAEWYAKPQSGSRVVTPGTLETRSATVEGASTVPGVRLGDRALFIDASARRLLSWFYDFGTDTYTTDDLSLLASHILGPGVKEIAWQKRPNRILWCLLRDGTLGAFTYHPKQDVLAWHLHDVGDPVDTIAVKPATGGERDELWMVVNRKKNGVDQRLVEVMEDRYSKPRGDLLKNAWYLWSGVRVTGSAIATVTGLGHLEGRTVIPFVDGVRQTAKVVTAGAVTVDTPGDTILVGLGVKSYIRTLPVDFGELADSLYSKMKHLVGLAVALKDAYGGFVRSGTRTYAEPLTPSGANVDAPELITGNVRIPPPEGAGKDLEIDVEFDGPYPATVTGLLPDWET